MAAALDRIAPGNGWSGSTPPQGSRAPGPAQEAASPNRDSLPDATRLSNLLLISTAAISKLSSGKSKEADCLFKV